MKKLSYEELLKRKDEEKDGTKGYLDFLKYYYNYGINFFTVEEKIRFYTELEDISVVDSKLIDYGLLTRIEDMCEELDCGTAEVDPNYFEKFDNDFIELFKRYDLI